MNPRVTRWIAPALVAALLAPVVRAEVKLPAILGPEMVLQQGLGVPIWGKAEPGEKVTVTFAGQDQDGHGGARDGKWRVTLDPMAASAEGGRSPSQENTINLEKVLVGEVWLCSGQSNMQMVLRSSQRRPRCCEPGQSGNSPVCRRVAFRHAALVMIAAQKWQVCTPESVEFFSAVGYYFGNTPQGRSGVPVGLINASWGGKISNVLRRDASRCCAVEQEPGWAHRSGSAEL